MLLHFSLHNPHSFVLNVSLPSFYTIHLLLYLRHERLAEVDICTILKAVIIIHCSMLQHTSCDYQTCKKDLNEYLTASNFGRIRDHLFDFRMSERTGHGVSVEEVYARNTLCISYLYELYLCWVCDLCVSLSVCLSVCFEVEKNIFIYKNSGKKREMREKDRLADEDGS